MEKYLLKDFEVEHKNPSEEALRRWRSAVSVVKNRRRRFRMVANLDKRSEAKKMRRKIKEKMRAARYVQKAAAQFLDAGGRADNKFSDEAREAGFSIDPDELASIVHSHDIKRLKFNGGVEGIAWKVSVSLNEGVHESDKPIRQKIYGINRYTEKPQSTFLEFLWDSLQDWTLIRLVTFAVLSMRAGLATADDGFRILLWIFMVAIVTATSDYKQSLQFRDLDKEKKKIFIQVTRGGQRQKVSIYDLVVGDIVHLSIGDQVPADGIFILGHSMLIDESSLSGESESVNIYEEKPFLLSGTKVQDGSGKMLVTAVGMRTEWGKLMETLSEGGEDETPLQVKLNGVATIIGKIGLTFALIAFLVLTGRFLVEKSICSKLSDWSLVDVLTLINYLAVPERPLLAVTLSLAFAIKKLLNHLALVRYLSACETMGSANCICTDKTGTLTTNHMVVDKIWIRHNIVKIEGKKTNSEDIFQLEMSRKVLNILLQAIFQNTNSEVVKDKEGRNAVLGSPTESALLEFGLLLGGDFEAQHTEFKRIKVEPFNSIRKKMSVLVALPEGGIRAFCKGASEIVLEMCDKVVDDNGEPVPLSEEQKRHVSDEIDGFASEALRTLCLAFKDLDNSSDENNIPDSGYTLIAVVGIKNPVRPGVREAVQTCLAAGITVRMVTGDHINTAKAIAKECGILTSDGEAIRGPELRNMSTDEMKCVIPKLQVVARSSPMDKHILVTQLRNTFRKVVAVTGDGIDDAPALREADVGLAMGIAGTEVAKENADVIILDDNFSTIVNVVKWGRAVYINMQKFSQFLLTVNAVAVMIDLVSACISETAPLADVQLLWVDIIVETLGALALATEPPNDGLMKRPPVGRGENLITNIMWRNIIGQSIYQLIVLGVLNFYGKQLLGLGGADATQVLSTVIFNSFVFCQVFNEINSREIEKINVFRGIFNSWMFIGIIVTTVAFQVMIVEFLGAFASTVPLSWQLWLVSVLLGAISMPIAIIVKFIPV